MKLWHYTTGVAFCGSVLLAGCGPESLAPPSFPPLPGPTAPGPEVASLTIPPGLDLIARDFGFSFINPRIANVALRDGDSGTASGTAAGRLFSQGGFTSLAFRSPFNIRVNAVAANDAPIVGNLNTPAVTFPTINSPLRVGSRFALEDGSFEIIVDSINRASTGAIAEGEEITIAGRTTRIGTVNLQNQATGLSFSEIVTLDNGQFSGVFVAELGPLCQLDTSPSTSVLPRGNYDVVIRANPALTGIVGQQVSIRVTRTRASGSTAIAELNGNIPASGEIRINVREIFTLNGLQGIADTVFTPGPVRSPIDPLEPDFEDLGRVDVISITNSPNDICAGVSDLTRTLQ